MISHIPISDILRNCHAIFNRNLGGISQEDSLRSLPGGGNKINWIAGHIAVSRDTFRKVLGLEVVIPPNIVEIYKRGSSDISPAQALPLTTLIEYYNASHEPILESLSKAPLFEDAEPLDSLTMLTFHESYHVGQLGLARRILGFEGTIK